MAFVQIDTTKIIGRSTFHEHCRDVFGFPDFYGENMDAWIDCLSYLTESDNLSRFILQENEQLQIQVSQFESFNQRLPDLASSFLECVASVNMRYIAAGEIPRLVLVLI